jgi:N utilization substance protein B
MAGRKKSGTNARSAARLVAVQALYQMDLAKTDLNAVIEEFTAFRMQGRDEADEGQAVELAGADQTYFAELVRGAVRRQREIDPLVDKTLATGWRLVRVDSTLRAILRVAVYELMERIDVPARVVINEYINIAHAFFSEDQPRVVNGVLDHLAHDLRPAEFDGASSARGSKGRDLPVEEN